MVDIDDTEQYQSRYLSDRLTGGESDTRVLETVMDNEGMLTHLRIYGEESQTFNVNEVTLNNNGTEDTENTKLALAGQDIYEIGDFEDPVIEVGSQTKIAIELTGTVSADTEIGINARIDERTG